MVNTNLQILQGKTLNAFEIGNDSAEEINEISKIHITSLTTSQQHMLA